MPPGFGLALLFLAAVAAVVVGIAWVFGWIADFSPGWWFLFLFSQSPCRFRWRSGKQSAAGRKPGPRHRSSKRPGAFGSPPLYSRRN